MKVAITGTHTILGRYITDHLLQQGARILNLSNQRNIGSLMSLNKKVKNIPLIFQRQHLHQSLQGCDALIQTYWVKYNNLYETERQSVIRNSIVLIDSAKAAGVKKVIFTSHTKPDLESPFPYIREKAQVECYLADSGIKFGILRSCAVFGRIAQESVLINNIAYLVRKFPVFPLPGEGDYYMQFIHASDFAELTWKTILWQGPQNVVVDTVSPQKMTFKDLVEYIAQAVGSHCRVVPHINQNILNTITKPFKWYFDDLLLQNNDLEMMIQGINCSEHEAQGWTSLLVWINQNKDNLGRKWITPVKYYYN